MDYFLYICNIMTNEKKKIVFIINPISGTVSAEEIAKECKELGVDVVVAVGGDGTVNEVARGITNSDTALGIIPCGSGNGLARHLMLPMDFKKDIDILNQCEIHDLDYGIINEHAFFCTCGMGFDAFISMKFAAAGKRGLTTYVENVLKEGLNYKPETYRIEDAFLISCANASQYGNNAYIAPHASMHDGMLDVIIMEPFDALEAPQVAIEMLNKTLDKNQKIKTFRTKHIRIHREKPGVIHFDGDPVMADADVDIRLIPGGIKVVVNPEADRSKRRPNRMQTALSEFFNDINVVRDDLVKQSRNIQALNKKILRRLNNI